MNNRIGILRMLTLSIVCAMGVSGLALAHAGLESSIPAAGEILEDVPHEIVLTFTEDIKVIGASILDAREQKVGGLGQPKVDGKILSIPLNGSLKDGTYRVEYQVVGIADSHPIIGSVSFSIRSNQ